MDGRLVDYDGCVIFSPNISPLKFFCWFFFLDWSSVGPTVTTDGLPDQLTRGYVSFSYSRAVVVVILDLLPLLAAYFWFHEIGFLNWKLLTLVWRFVNVL